MVESVREFFSGGGVGAVRMSELPERIRQQLELNFQKSGITPAVTQRYYNDMGFLSRNNGELVRQFPNKWIAIKSFTVLAAKNTHDKLLEALKDMEEKPGLVLRYSLQRVNASPSVQFLNQP